MKRLTALLLALLLVLALTAVRGHTEGNRL